MPRAHLVKQSSGAFADAAFLRQQLIADYLGLAKPVLVANLLIWPLGLVAMQAYLTMFVQRMALTPMPFVPSLAIAVGIAWAAAGVHVVAATRIEPARVLRHE